MALKYTVSHSDTQDEILGKQCIREQKTKLRIFLAASTSNFENTLMSLQVRDGQNETLLYLQVACNLIYK